MKINDSITTFSWSPSKNNLSNTTKLTKHVPKYKNLCNGGTYRQWVLLSCFTNGKKKKWKYHSAYFLKRVPFIGTCQLKVRLGARTRWWVTYQHTGCWNRTLERLTCWPAGQEDCQIQHGQRETSFGALHSGITEGKCLRTHELCQLGTTHYRQHPLPSFFLACPEERAFLWIHTLLGFYTTEGTNNPKPRSSHKIISTSKWIVSSTAHSLLHVHWSRENWASRGDYFRYVVRDIKKLQPFW